MTRVISLFFLALALISQVSAQLGVRLALSQRQYLSGEPILLQIGITNHTGNAVTLANQGRNSWMEIIIKKGDGESVSLIAQPSFNALKLGVGQTRAQVIDLTKYYHLQNTANFSIEALVKISKDDAYNSNRLLFTVINARADWSQKVGVPGKPGTMREYRLMNFSNGQKSQLYMQVANPKSNYAIKTFPFGESLDIRKPQAAVDKGQILHVLYLGNAEFYVHAKVDINGNMLGRELYQRGNGPDARLMTFADGSVKVAGPPPFDVKAAAAAAKKQTRSASDRPNGVFQ